MEKLYGLIGEKLGHTYSPFIHGEILKMTGIEGHYGLFEVKREKLKYAVSGLKALGYSGVNVTIPYKTDIIEHLDFLSEEAKKIGAVNVINIDRNDLTTGYNTDYYGFGMMLKKNDVIIDGEAAAVLGTGGASKSVVQYLKDNRAKDIVLVTRDAESAKIKYPNDKIISYDELHKLKNCFLVINTTPVGMYPNTKFSPLKEIHLKNFACAIDLIYNPSQTLFLKKAEILGLKTMNGLYMLIAQAVKSQEIWNDAEIPENVIEHIVSLCEQVNHE